MVLPLQGSIERGRVSRIEPYGAFVDLENYRCRGLVHISQIVRLERVEDAISLDDVVWVKVIDVTEEEKDGRTRNKIRLSMKDASQDGSMRDLREERASSEALKDQIAQNLSSSIGMAVALDPMAKRSSIVLKTDGSKSALINGYALVDDDEGEPPATEPPQQVRPMGRGRGTTLPAWMTKSYGPSAKDLDKEKRKKEKKLRKERKHQEREQRKRRKLERKREDFRQRKRTRRRDDESTSDSEKSRGRGKRRRKYSNERSCSSRDDQSYSSDSSSGNHSDGGRYSVNDMPFRSVDEAKKFIAQFEADGR